MSGVIFPKWQNVAAEAQAECKRLREVNASLLSACQTMIAAHEAVPEFLHPTYRQACDIAASFNTGRAAVALANGTETPMTREEEIQETLHRR